MDITAKAFLDALAVGESGGRYDILYGGGKFADFAKFPEWEGKDNSHAAGRYQFEPATWRECAAKLGLTDFSPANQDAAAWWLACHVYADRIGRALATDLAAGKLDNVAPALHSTWTSLGPSFPNRYKVALQAAGGAVASDNVADKLNAAELAQISTPAGGDTLHTGYAVGAGAGVAGALVGLFVWLLSLKGVQVPAATAQDLTVLFAAVGGALMHMNARKA